MLLASCKVINTMGDSIVIGPAASRASARGFDEHRQRVELAAVERPPRTQCATGNRASVFPYTLQKHASEEAP
jgi:hypothetical protein